MPDPADPERPTPLEYRVKSPDATNEMSLVPVVVLATGTFAVALVVSLLLSTVAALRFGLPRWTAVVATALVVVLLTMLIFQKTQKGSDERVGAVVGLAVVAAIVALGVVTFADFFLTS